MFALAALVLASGCQSSGTDWSADPWEHEWFLSEWGPPGSVVGWPSTDHVERVPDIAFDDGYASGSDGCNSFTASYSYSDPMLTFEGISYQALEVRDGDGEGIATTPIPCDGEWLEMSNAIQRAFGCGVEVLALNVDLDVGPAQMVWHCTAQGFDFHWEPYREG